MRRVVLGLAGAGAVALAAAVASVPVLRAPDADAGARLLAELERATGLTARANGSPKVTLFPLPRVRVEGVSLAHGSDAPFLVARELSGRLSVVGLLAGRVELAEVLLDQPQLALDRAPASEILSALKARRTAAPPAIRLADGRLEWKGRIVDKVEAGLALPQGGGQLALSGFGRYAGRNVEATLQLADPVALSRGDAAPFRARVEGGGARALFDGEAAEADGGLRLSGDVSVRADDLGAALGWLGARPAHGAAAAWRASFAGRGQLDASGLQISNAELDLAGESFLGAGRLTAGADGPAVEATLDAGTVDLAPYLDLLAPEFAGAGGAWSGKPLDLDGLRGWTLDLRLSADEMRLGPLLLEQPALTAAVARGGLDLAVGEANAYGGAVGGRLSLEPHAGETRLRFEGGATDVSLGETLHALTGRRTMTGALTAEAALESRGASAAALVAALKGRMTAHVVDGAFESVGRSRTLSLAGLSGRVDFTRAEAAMTVAGGVARADPVLVSGDRAAFSLSGDASLVEQRIALTGFVKPSEGSWELPVRVDGPLFAPKLKPDLSGRTPRGEARRHPDDATTR